MEKKLLFIVFFPKGKATIKGYSKIPFLVTRWLRDMCEMFFPLLHSMFSTILQLSCFHNQYPEERIVEELYYLGRRWKRRWDRGEYYQLFQSSYSNNIISLESPLKINYKEIQKLP